MLLLSYIVVGLTAQVAAQGFPNRGTRCNGNKDCEARCYMGDYTVTQEDGNVGFMCQLDDPRNTEQYACVECESRLNFSFIKSSIGPFMDRECMAVRKRNSCVIRPDRAHAFRQLCLYETRQGKYGKPNIHSATSYNTAVEQCSSIPRIASLELPMGNLQEVMD
jgi:hypothetical protein